MKFIAILGSHNGSGFDAIHEAIQNSLLHVNIKLVVSNNPDANILKKAKHYSIDNFIVNEKTHEHPDKEIFELLKMRECNYVFLSGYMKKLSSLLTSNFTIINSHPSLLPKFGGAGMYGRFVHEAVLRSNEKISGVTVHEVNEFYDEGKIILQEELHLSENESIDSLESRIKQLEKKVIIEALNKCLK